VNDGGAAPDAIWRNMEGIVRRTWRQEPQTDIVFTYTIHEGMIAEVKKGLCPRSASAMELFDGIPSVNFRLEDPEPELQQLKYQGTRLWVGQILLLGDLIE
jgi:hypothetical protein